MTSPADTQPQTPLPPPAGTPGTVRPAAPAPGPAPAGNGAGGLRNAIVALALIVAIGAAVAVAMVWQRMTLVEQQLARRQQDSGNLALEARALAKQSMDLSTDATAKLALATARLDALDAQKTQVDALLQSVSNTRDETLASELESTVRLAQQQMALTGSVVPLLDTLKDIDARLEQRKQPALDPVRRAVAHDIQAVQDARVPDLPDLAARLDDLLGEVDNLPLANGEHVASAAVGHSASTSPAPEPPAANADGNFLAAAGHWVGAQASAVGAAAWNGLRSLVRVSRIDQPESLLLTPEQGYALRENLKLRLLNARLAPLMRQFPSVQLELQQTETAVNRYFDLRARRTQDLLKQLHDISDEARGTDMPRAQATLAALAAAGAATTNN